MTTSREINGFAVLARLVALGAVYAVAGAGILAASIGAAPYVYAAWLVLT